MRNAYVLGLLAAVGIFVACSSDDTPASTSSADAGADASGEQAQCGAIEVCPCDDGFRGSAGCGTNTDCDQQCASHGGFCSYSGAKCTCGDGTAQYTATCPSQATCALVCVGHCGDGDSGVTTDCLDASADAGPKDAALD